MAWFRKKSDPISARARVLNEEIAALEAQIKTLDERVQKQQKEPRQCQPAVSRGADLPQAPIASHPPSAPASTVAPAPATHEPIFEKVEQDALQARTEGSSTPEHYNQLGVRKYDLPALVRRIKGYFQGPSTTNPKLVSYLAAGGIQGLRPLRYEKRVARNRFIALVIFLFIVLLGLLAVYVRR